MNNTQTEVSKRKESKIHWLLLAIFPLGWWVTYGFFQERLLSYTLLSLVSFIACSVVLGKFQMEMMKEIHLWIIFLLFLVGYYVKFYVLLYLVQTDSTDLLVPSFGQGIYSLISETILLEAYQFVTLVFIALCISLAVLLTMGDKARHADTPLYQENDADPIIVVRQGSLILFLSIPILLSLITAYLQESTGIGVTSSVEVVLPYRLAGAIQYIRTDFIPILFLLMIWLADRIKNRLVLIMSVLFHLLHGATSSLLSTSKSGFALAVISLLILWLVSGNFSKIRRNYLLALVPLVILLSGVLSISRGIRNTGDVGTLDSLPTAVFDLFSYAGPIETFMRLALALLLRINGIDPLLYIVRYQPSFDLGRTWSILAEAPIDVNYMYGQLVLDVTSPDLIGVAFSISLLGFFYFVFGNQLATIVGVSCYTLFWHVLFRKIAAAHFILSRVIFTMLAIMLALFTSEGSLQALPIRLFLLLIAGILGESLIRRLVGKRATKTVTQHAKA